MLLSLVLAMEFSLRLVLSLPSMQSFFMAFHRQQFGAPACLSSSEWPDQAFVRKHPMDPGKDTRQQS